MKDVRCRYNNTHVLKSNKLLEHEDACPDRLNRNDIKVCPYNKDHKINIKIYDKHIKICSSKPKIDSKIQMEISDYIIRVNANQIDSTWNDQNDSCGNAWGSNKAEIINQLMANSTKQIIEECKDMEYTEEDHIFLEAYII